MADLTRRQFIAASTAATIAATQAGGETVSDTKSLMAGLATRDITPPPGVPMWGYGDRPGPATGTLDPLRAHALVLRVDVQHVAIVTMDLGRVPRPRVLNRVRAHAKKAGITNVVFTATHTHGGPVMEMDDMPHIAHIADMLQECIAEAAAKMVPVKIGLTSTTFDISHNRRLITKDGKCEMLWRNEKKMPTSPVDREATVIKLDTADGKPFATLVHFACHPVVLAGDNVEYTADWVGEMCRQVKEQTGAECLYLQGGCGDINPYLDKTPRNQRGVESMRSVGKEAADAVLAALPRIDTRAPESPSIAYVERDVEVGLRWDFDDPKQKDVFRAVFGKMFDVYLDDLSPDLKVPLAVLVLNDDLAFAFMPGELFTQHQLMMKSHAPMWPTYGATASVHSEYGSLAAGGDEKLAVTVQHRRALLVGYSNDFHIYFPTIKDAAAGGYGGISATYVGLGAGEKLVLEAQAQIGKLTRRFKDECVPADFQSVDAKTT